MKTLYININGEAIKSDNNIEIIGSVEDSIVESFYISLGEAIAGGVTGIKYKPLVADFANAKPNEFNSFSDQWQEVKTLLLGENPSGDYDFTLSSEYLDWLKMNATYSTIYYKKYQNQRQAKVKLNLDELYEDTVDAIRRKVIRFLQTNDNYKNFDEFVVNDDAVTRRSLLVRSVKSKFEDIAFVLFEKWKSATKESEEKEKACPKCGNNPSKCETIQYVILHSVGPNRSQVIKLIKEWWGLDLKEATNIADNAPSIVMESVPGHRAINFKNLAKSMKAEVVLEKIEDRKETDEIEKGMFGFDNVTLGKTTLSELKKKGYKIHRGFYRYDNMRSYVSEFSQYSGSYIVIDNWDYKDVEEWCECCFANPSVVNRETLLNTKQVVTYFSFNWNDCPFLVNLGFYGDEELDEEYDYDDDVEDHDDDDYKNREIANYIAELFEDKGYIRIEPLMNDDDEHNITLAKTKPNINGDYIFIRITDNDKTIDFHSNLVTEWVSEKTGKTFSSKNSKDDRNRGKADNDDFPSEISSPFPIDIHGYTLATFLDVVKKSFGLKGSRVTFSALSRKTEKLVEKLEDTFGFYIPEEEVEEWNSLDDILISLERRAFE